MPNQMDGHQQLVVQLESQKELNAAENIPQLDGDGIDSEEKAIVEEEETLSFTFVSEYADEDVRESLEELVHDNLLPSTTTLISRVRIKNPSADHLCTVRLKLPVGQRNFSWPGFPSFPEMFKDVKRLPV